MDMKRILQAMDGVATKPVVGANDMKKFLQVVKEADLNQQTEWNDLVHDIQATGKTAQEATDIIAAWLKKNPAGTAEQATLQILPQFDKPLAPGQTFNPQQKNDGNSYLPGEREYAQQYAAKGNLASAEYLKNLDLSKSSYDPSTGIKVTVTPGTTPIAKESKYDDSADLLKLAGVLTETPNDMARLLRVVKEADLNTAAPAPAAPVPAAPAPAAPAPASTLPPDQIAYNQLRAQLDSADSLRGGANTYTDVSPAVTASTNAMRTKLAQMAAALKAKGIDAAAEYDAPDPAVPAAAPVDLNQKYATEEVGMSRFLSIINEGSNPHKVALPIQMAMQHYTTPKKVIPLINTQSLLKGYLQELDEEAVEEQAHKRQLINQYAQTIANRVMVRESRLDEKSVSQKQARTMAAAAHDPKFAKKVGIKSNVAKEFNKADTGTKQLSQAMKKKKVNEAPIDMSGDPNDPTIYGHEKANPMSLKGRIMSARAQLKELAQLADSDSLVAWEEICKKAQGGMFMGLEQNLEQIRHGISELAEKRKKGGVGSRGIDRHIGEDNDPCRKDYKQIGTKKKGGKTVPNCVPKK